MRTRRLAIVLAAASSLVMAAETTRADEPASDTKRACAADHEQAQRARKRSELRAARASLVRCAQESCPKWISSECATWLGEVERSVPSVVLHARDGSGAEVADVSVSMDGASFVERLDGRAIDVDPGTHEFVFTAAGRPPVRVSVVVHEGAKSVPVNADLGGGVAPSPRPPDDPDKKEEPARIGAWVPITLAGVGAVALGSFAFFGLSGYSDERNDLEACNPACSPDRIDSVQTKYLVADVSLVVAVVALGASAIVALTR